MWAKVKIYAIKIYFEKQEAPGGKNCLVEKIF
jgi:hypothetical protein